MGRLILVSGANNSGKSAFAENLTSHIRGDRYYIATMIPKTEENLTRIKKHCRQREWLGFQTLELAYQVGNAPVADDAVVLLEDISNLLANCLFDKQENSVQVLSDICTLLERCNTLIAVTITDLDISGYEGETKFYINSLNYLNSKLFELADIAIEMKNHSPCIKKGELKNAY